MNKQEAIKRVEELYGYGSRAKTVTDIISQIHEPLKVVVPKFVAEWYERNKDDINTALYSAIIGTYRKVNGENNDSPDTFEEWIVYEDNSILILVQMHLFGYEVEKEQLYTVTDGNKLYLKEFDELNAIIIIDDVVGAVDYAKRYSDKIEAQKAADELGWIVQGVE
ncbi:TPA: DUF1642 domain-containing protein [Streptococcus suis]|nr:DUF1642 domain-containing protein [Streptococcus suis]HEM2758164.1 DUF1642 domain-containing protein [Streptococcus suis]HEM2764527.1 DUF1642 domain-containing protein [Streptococcus suis]